MEQMFKKPEPGECETEIGAIIVVILAALFVSAVIIFTLLKVNGGLLWNW